MEMGDVYTKHVRGSRYVYDTSTIYYKHESIKIPTKTDVSDIIEDIIEVRDEDCGRIIINEEGDIITYKRQKEDEWIPLYVRKLDRELIFNQVDLNPTKIKTGLLWTGFLRKHGAKYRIAKKGYVYFLETIQTNWKSQKISYRIENFRRDFLSKLRVLKGSEAGSFWINEYGHVWTTVNANRMKYLLDTGAISKEDIEEQWKSLSTMQKNLINNFIAPTQDRYNNQKTISWYPIYIGKYEGTIYIERPNEPKIIYAVDDYDKWID